MKKHGEIKGLQNSALNALVNLFCGCLGIYRRFKFTHKHRARSADADPRQDWQKFYRKYFRLSTSFSDVQIPSNPNDFDRVIFIAKGLEINYVIKIMRKHFKVWAYSKELDEDVNSNLRLANNNYAIRIRERVEADKELMNITANTLTNNAVNTITLLERLVLELKYFSETGQHMDIDNGTICAGSRGRTGEVPGVYWNNHVSDGGELTIEYCFPGCALDVGMRARQVVS